MILKLVIDDQEYALNVPEAFLAQAESFFARMDSDMDAGWQMGRDWVAAPDRLQRGQIAANKLVTALENDDHNLGRLMAGYLLSRLPGLETVHPDLGGEMQETRFEFAAEAETRTAEPQPAAATAVSSGGMSRMAALNQAGQEVSKVFKVGKQWRFSVYDREREHWEDGPLVNEREQAETLRDQAVKQRFDELVRG